MYWVDRDVEQIQQRFADHIAAGSTILVRDEKTASGRVHVGSLRGVAVHSLVARALRQAGVQAKFVYEINDFDPMDGLPSYLPKEEYAEHMGKPLRDVPSPEPDKAENFAEYYGQEFERTIEGLGFQVEFSRLYPKYKAGEFNDVITQALEHPDQIRAIYKEVSGSEKPDDWYPLQVVCPDCGKVGTTKVTGFDGSLVSYVCLPDLVEWATGCGGSGEISPYNGNAKLAWKVEWAAKWKVYGVHVEGAGKDHNAAGGSRDVASHIVGPVFQYDDPYDIKYEFLLLGGKKMSSSKGIGAAASEMAALLPTELVRLLMIGNKPQQAVDFDASGDTVVKLFDRYDELAAHYFDRQDGERQRDFVRQFEMIHPEGAELPDRFLPPFSQIVFLSQMPNADLEARVTEMKGSTLTDADKAEIAHRVEAAQRWLEMAAPEQYIYQIQEEIPSDLQLDEEQREALGRIADLIEAGKRDEELQTALFAVVKDELGVQPKKVFQAIYQSLLGRDSGPKAGTFLSALDTDMVVSRFRELSRS